MLNALVWLIAWIPLPVLYVLADCVLFPLCYYLVGYRRVIVRQNLASAFPEKTDKERKQIERQFYHHFVDLIVEIIYERHMSSKQLRKRVMVQNLDLIEHYVETHQGCMMLLGHCGNWEWLVDMQQRFKNKQIQMYNAYSQLSNKQFDKLMLNLRSKSKGILIEKKRMLRTVVENQKKKQLSLYGMIADQSPNRHNLNFWTQFFNQETAFLTGSETLARRFDYPLVYVKITRPQRGHYLYEIVPVCEQPNQLAENEVTERYVQLLEDNIKADPAGWLWTHKRWKHKRPIA